MKHNHLKKYFDKAGEPALVRQYGRVTKFVGMVIEARGIESSIGGYCEIVNEATGRKYLTEVVGFKDKTLLLMPFDKGRGISLGDLVTASRHSAKIGISDSLLGHAIDPFCKPLDKAYTGGFDELLELYPEPNNPLNKCNIDQTVHTGIKVIDNFVPIGKGQSIGLFSGSGVGKTSLMRMIVNNVDSDIKIIALVGERGREVAEFVSKLKEAGEDKYIVVAAASDQPPLTRVHAVYTATAIAEHFCNRGKNVFLIVDSITRFAMAQREVGLAIGEPPTAKGYTPSVFSQIPLLVERVGNYRNKGSITGLYTVLVEGDDLDEPISDHMRSVLDGHIVLSRELTQQSVYPPVDILKSKSRLDINLKPESQLKTSSNIIKQYSKYRSIQDLVEMGVYKKGDSLENDKILAAKSSVDEFISQLLDEQFTYNQIQGKIKAIEHELI